MRVGEAVKVFHLHQKVSLRRSFVLFDLTHNAEPPDKFSLLAGD